MSMNGHIEKLCAHLGEVLSNMGRDVGFLVVGTISKEKRPPQDQLWMEQYLASLKYWPI